MNKVLRFLSTSYQYQQYRFFINSITSTEIDTFAKMEKPKVSKKLSDKIFMNFQVKIRDLVNFQITNHTTFLQTENLNSKDYKFQYQKTKEIFKIEKFPYHVPSNCLPRSRVFSPHNEISQSRPLGIIRHGLFNSRRLIGKLDIVTGSG